MITFPKHEASLTLEHNLHKTYYKTVAESIAMDDYGYRPNDWVSEAQKAKAIDSNDCWILHWYPDSPVGFRLLSAADLDVLLAAAKSERIEGGN